MPRCVECGTETARSEMYGLPHELRCAGCAGRRQVSLSTLPKNRPAYNTPAWSVTLVFMAFVVWGAEQIPGTERLHALWNIPTRIWDGEVWRLLTSMLPHANFLHLFFNCYWIAVFGIVTEREIGSLRFLGLVMLLAVGSSAAEFLYSPAPGIGLSGVVYGLFGFLFAQRLYKDYARALMNDSTMKAMFGWFVLCVILTYAAKWPIANMAHAGGFVVGWLVGNSIVKRNTQLRVAAVTIVVASMAGLTTYMPWNKSYRFYQENKQLIRMIEERQIPLELLRDIEG